MPTCDYCGGEIEFRYMDGRPTPIHLSGGRCRGNGSASVADTPASRPFATTTSYSNPNAHCPVCGRIVFFYQSPFGGRVFFEDAGWPWEKHPCTDNSDSQRGAVKRIKEAPRRFFVSPTGKSLKLYELAEVTDTSDGLHLVFRQVDNHLRVFRVSVQWELLKAASITRKDLLRTPGFIISFFEDHRLIEFISGRKKLVDRLILPRTAAAS